MEALVGSGRVGSGQVDLIQNEDGTRIVSFLCWIVELALSLIGSSFSFLVF